MDSSQFADGLLTRIRIDFPDPIPPLLNYGYPDSLALCAIDSVYSLSARYGSAQNVVARYKATRSDAGATPGTDSLVDLVEVIDGVGGGVAAASALFNNRQVAPGTQRRKAEALYGAARRLTVMENGVATTEDLRALGKEPERLAGASEAWCAEPGLGFASWRYLLMLAGVPGVKMDRMISRYVGSVVESHVSKEQIESAFAYAARELGVQVHELDHAIWRKQSGRDASK